MNSVWATSLDQIWHSLEIPTWLTFPVWLTLAAAGLFGVITLITLLRAEKSVANGALTVITLLAIGVALTSTMREFSPSTGAGGMGSVGDSQSQPPPQVSAGAPALSCIDEMAGDFVLAACEKVLFGSADSVAAAISYTAARISRLTAFGDVASAEHTMTPDLQALRHSIERDRYGLVAYVLLTRDHCTPVDCAAFGSLTDHSQIVANMDERIYDRLIARYSPSWNAPPVATAALGPPAGLGTSVPTGKPTNAEFPSAASTPAVSIMTPEPGQSAAATAATPRAPAATASASNTPPPTTRPTPAPHPATAAAPLVAAAPRKPAPRPRTPAVPVQIAPAAPVQIAPAPPAEPAPAPAALND